MDWSEIKTKYNVNCNPDTIRKGSSTIFGGKFRSDYLKSQIYSNPKEFSKEKEIDKKLEELRKERIKLQTANIERNRIDRAQSRQEMYYEYVGNAITSLPLPEFRPIVQNDSNEKEYIATLSDLHFGAVFTSEHNKYSPEIARYRMEYLTSRLISFVEEKSLSRLHIISLGDMLQGLLRVNDLRINDSTVVKSCVEVSRLIALMLNTLSEYTNVEYYHVPSANHTQIRPLGSKANELMDEDLEYLIGNYIKDLCSMNKRINVHLAEEGKQYIQIDIMGFTIIAMHGHQIKNIETSIRDLSMLYSGFVDYVILGHYHSGKQLTSYEGICHDCEVLVAPSFVGSDLYSDSILKGSKAASCIYGIDYISGHDETYKIILN